MEKYCLRVLLLNRKGAKSFNDLKTVNCKQYSTYREAVEKPGLIEDDKEWITCLT